MSESVRSELKELQQQVEKEIDQIWQRAFLKGALRHKESLKGASKERKRGFLESFKGSSRFDNEAIDELIDEEGLGDA